MDVEKKVRTLTSDVTPESAHSLPAGGLQFEEPSK